MCESLFTLSSPDVLIDRERLHFTQPGAGTKGIPRLKREEGQAGSEFTLKRISKVKHQA